MDAQSTTKREPIRPDRQRENGSDNTLVNTLLLASYMSRRVCLDVSLWNRATVFRLVGDCRIIMLSVVLHQAVTKVPFTCIHCLPADLQLDCHVKIRSPPPPLSPTPPAHSRPWLAARLAPGARGLLISG